MWIQISTYIFILTYTFLIRLEKVFLHFLWWTPILINTLPSDLNSRHRKRSISGSEKRITRPHTHNGRCGVKINIDILDISPVEIFHVRWKIPWLRSVGFDEFGIRPGPFLSRKGAIFWCPRHFRMPGSGYVRGPFERKPSRENITMFFRQNPRRCFTLYGSTLRKFVFFFFTFAVRIHKMRTDSDFWMYRCFFAISNSLFIKLTTSRNCYGGIIFLLGIN